MLAARRSANSVEEGAPVGDAVLSRLYRGDVDEIAGIVSALPQDVRARLAAFCYGRTHLRTIGREIAAHCDEQSLKHYAGAALGQSLIEAKRLRQADSFGASPTFSRPKVSLATAAHMRRREPMIDDEIDRTDYEYSTSEYQPAAGPFCI